MALATYSESAAAVANEIKRFVELKNKTIMKTYNEKCKDIPEKKWEVLQSYFPENNWGVYYQKDTCCDGRVLEMYEICRISDDGKTWTHHAWIAEGDDDIWELYELHIKIDEKFVEKWGEEYRKWIGTEQTAMNIYGRYKYFASAVSNLRQYGTSVNGRKAKEVYV